MSDRKNAVNPEYMKKGIYGIRNKINNYIYIGSASKWFNDRWYDHRTQLNKNRHKNIKLQRAWNKYGKDAFEFFIIEILDGDKSDILAVEQFYLDVFHGQKFCYNLNPKATGGIGNGGKCKGRKVTQEARDRMREAQKKRWLGHTKKSITRSMNPVGRPRIDIDIEVVRYKKEHPTASLRHIAKVFNVGFVTIRNILLRSKIV